MTTLYISLAILCAALQILFIFLLTKEGRRQALQETEKNLIETFQNLDSATKTQLLLNADLNNEEMILLVNNQTKSSAIEIITATMDKFELVEKDIKNNNQELKTIKVNTANIFKTIEAENKYINPEKFKISISANVSNSNVNGNAMGWLSNLKDSKFKIWITFRQNNKTIITYLNSKGKWHSNNEMDFSSIDYSDQIYSVFPTNEKLIVKGGSLLVEENSSFIKFTRNKKLYFDIHFMPFENKHYVAIYDFKIKMSGGQSIRPVEMESKSDPFNHPVINNSELGWIKGRTILSGYFEFK